MKDEAIRKKESADQNSRGNSTPNRTAQKPRCKKTQIEFDIYGKTLFRFANFAKAKSKENIAAEQAELPLPSQPTENLPAQRPPFKKTEIDFDVCREKLIKFADDAEAKVKEKLAAKQAELPLPTQPTENLPAQKQPCHKTQIDFDVCRETIIKFASVAEAKLKEKIAAKQAEPPLPVQPIEKYSMASPCPSKWEELSGCDHFRFSGQCKHYIYDFTSMRIEDVEQLVYTREGKKNIQFFRRKDGRFLTTDCPRGKRMRQKQMLLTVVAVAVFGGMAVLSFTISKTNSPAVLSSDHDQIDETSMSKQPKIQTAIGSQLANSSSNSEGYATSTNDTEQTGNLEDGTSSLAQSAHAIPPIFLASNDQVSNETPANLPNSESTMTDYPLMPTPPPMDNEPAAPVVNFENLSDRDSRRKATTETKSKTQSSNPYGTNTLQTHINTYVKDYK